MKLSKSNIQVIVLGLLMLVVVGLIIWQFSPSTPVAAPPPSTSPTSRNAKAAGNAVKPPSPSGLSWISRPRLVSIVGEVKGGRDPFQDTLTLPPKPAVVEVPHSTSGKSNIGGVLPPIPPADEKVMVTLQWKTVREVRKRIEQEGILVDVTAHSELGQQMTLHGGKTEIAHALQLIKSMDKQNPIPDFKLVGVVSTPTLRYAAIRVDNAVYNLFEGETIPKLGWTVNAITSAGVRLSKGPQQVLIH